MGGPGPHYGIFYFQYNYFNRTSGMEGSITVNGMERNLSSFRKLSCYIMQDNQLHGNLTVEEAMAVATALKLSSNTSKKRKDEVVSCIEIYLNSKLCIS